jgi:hypothetical protein
MEQEEINLGGTVKKKSPLAVALKWAAIAAIVNIIIALIQHLLSDGFKKPGGMDILIQVVIICAALVLAGNEHKTKELGGSMTYGRGIGIGALFGVFLGVIVGIWAAFYMTNMIDPVAFENFQLEELEKMREKMEARGIVMSDSDIEKQLAMQKKFQTPVWMVIWTTISTTIMSTVLSLVTSIFTRSKS